MSGVLFSDIVATCVVKLQGLLDAREEPYTTGSKVSNKAIEGQSRMVTVQYSGGPGDVNTLDSTYLAVNVFDADEGEANDLMRMVRALFTGRGTGSMCDGDPITHTALNVGPTPIVNGTPDFQFRMVIQVQHRGANL